MLDFTFDSMINLEECMSSNVYIEVFIWLGSEFLHLTPTRKVI